VNLNYAKEEDMMSRKMTSAWVFFLAILLATIPAWSSTPGHINPAGSGKSLTTDLNTTADYILKTEIILARGGGGGNGGGNGGGDNGGQGGNGFGGGGQGGHDNGECDGTGDGGPGPGAGLGPDAGPGPGAGPGDGSGGI